MYNPNVEPYKADPESTLFDLHMLLSTGAGGAHTLDELSAWLQEAGFLVPSIIQVADPENTRLLVAQSRGRS